MLLRATGVDLSRQLVTLVAVYMRASFVVCLAAQGTMQSARYQVRLLCRAQTQDLESADVERGLGITKGRAAALRLLYACLCPLDKLSPNGPGPYGRFVEGMRAIVRQRVWVHHVVDFMRAVLEVPEGELFLLLALVDDGNKASGCWEHTRVREYHDEACQVCPTPACFTLGLASGRSHMAGSSGVTQGKPCHVFSVMFCEVVSASSCCLPSKSVS